ncbi:uncharacterized protein THITE_2024785, partial [Thermothielavioides terrestris NRRL 8126]
MTLLSLVGKTACITGATGGIGFAIATRFAQEGASVVLAGRSASKLEHALAKLQQVEPWATTPTATPDKPPAAHSTVCFDVRSTQGWETLVSKHPIDILVNCAGQTQQALLLRTSEARVDELLDSNLRSAVWGCRAAGKRMVAARRAGGAGGAGCIINVSSLLARRGAVGTSVYAAAKAGLLG